MEINNTPMGVSMEEEVVWVRGAGDKGLAIGIAWLHDPSEPQLPHKMREMGCIAKDHYHLKLHNL